MAQVRLGAGQGDTFAVEIRAAADVESVVARLQSAPGEQWQSVTLGRHGAPGNTSVFRDVLVMPKGVHEVAFEVRHRDGRVEPLQPFGRNYRPFELRAASCLPDHELMPLPPADDGQVYRSHQCSRPRAPVVQQPLGDVTPRPAPAHALRLFQDGLASFRKAGTEAPAEWLLLADGSVRIAGDAGIETRELFGPCELYLDYRIPDHVEGDGQHRGNSGVMFTSGPHAYEVQILDSFANPTYADGEAGALYGQFPPLANASRGSGVWQSLRVRFSGPRYDALGQLEEPARATVWHNDVLVHDNRAFVGPTAWKRHVPYAEAGPHGPAMRIHLQNHRDAVLDFRNAWLVT